MPPGAADYKVEIVTASGAPDMRVSIVGDQVVSIAGASPGDVLVVAPDGQSLVTAPSSTPGAHASTHAAAGSDPVTLTIAQTTGLQAALDSKINASLYDANTILAATLDDTPAALTVGSSTVVGRRAAGGIVAISYANLLSDLGAAPLASPALTGNPTAPTQAAADNSTRLATTAYANALVADAINDGITGIAPSQNAVFDALALKAPLASPTFTGTPAAPTAAQGTNTTQLATTAMVQSEVTLLAPKASPTFTGTVATPGWTVDGSGRIGHNGAVLAAAMDFLQGTHVGSATTLYARATNVTYPSTTTVLAYNHYSAVATAAAAFTLATAYGYYAEVPTIGASSAITTLIGFRAQNQGKAGVTNAYGISVAAQSGAATLNVACELAGGTTANLWLDSNTASIAGGIALGTGRDVGIYRDAANALTIDATSGLTLTGGLTIADAKNIALNTTTGTKIGTATNQKLGFYNATPIIQPVGASQAAVAATGSTNVTPFGYTTAAQADAIVTLVNALRTALVNLGLIKGAA